MGCVVIFRMLETFLVYPAPRYPQGDWQPNWPYEEVEFAAADGTRLHGWLLTQPQPRHWILYCHGNGTHVAYVAQRLQQMRERWRASIFVFDYRGYGRSAGRPDEPGVLADGDAALHWLAARSGQVPPGMVLMGRSLGGAVAVDLAARYGAKGLVLERTFARMTDVAARQVPLLPVAAWMRNRFPTIDRIQGYRGPLLVSHGSADRLVPMEQGRALFDASPSPNKQFVEMAGAEHNSPNTPEYEETLVSFLERL